MPDADPCRRPLTPVEEAKLFARDAVRAVRAARASWSTPSDADHAMLAVFAVPPSRPSGPSSWMKGLVACGPATDDRGPSTPGDPMTLEELTELKNLAAARERHLELAERVETRSIRSTTSLFGMPMTEDLEDVIRTGMAAEYRRRAGIAEANLRELGVLFPGDTVPLPSGTAPEGEPLIQVTFRVAGVTAVKAAMSAAEVERMRAACQAADDGYRVEA